MSASYRISFTTLALLAAGAFTLAAYAGDNTNNTDMKHPAAAQANPATSTGANPNQQGAERQNSAQQNANQQNANQPQTYRVNMNPGVIEQGRAGRNGRQNIDLFVIPCLINANNAEVALGNIAAQHAQSSDVKEFAQHMIKDHTEQAKQLEQLQTTLTNSMRPQSPNNTPVAAALFEINQEIEQTCLANAQRELEQQSGAEFDRCYAGMQLGMHMQVNSVLSVLKNHVTSPDLRKAIDEASQLTARHLDEAKKLVKDLESNQRGNNNSTTNATR